LITESQVEEALSRVMHPELGRNLVELGMIRDVKTEDSEVRFTLALPSLTSSLQDQLLSEAKAAVLALDGVQKAEIDLVESVSARPKDERRQARDGGREWQRRCRQVLSQ